MLEDHRGPIDQYLPRESQRGCVLVVSDYRPLNIGHAAALCLRGYAVYTAITCTDVPRVFETYPVGDVDLVVFAAQVHGWHHEEGEERPPEMTPETDLDWQTRNLRQVVDHVCGRQARPPRVMIAVELTAFARYETMAAALTEAGVTCRAYSAGDPHALVDLLMSEGWDADAGIAKRR